jgi:hypothetical protein
VATISSFPDTRSVEIVAPLEPELLALEYVLGSFSAGVSAPLPDIAKKRSLVSLNRPDPVIELHNPIPAIVVPFASKTFAMARTSLELPGNSRYCGTSSVISRRSRRRSESPSRSNVAAKT